MRVLLGFILALGFAAVQAGELRGLGETRTSWEARYGPPDKTAPCPVDCYDNGALWVIYEGERILHIEIPWEPSADMRDAHTAIKKFAPEDGTNLRPYTSEYSPQSFGDVYRSNTLAASMQTGEYAIVHQVGRDNKVFSSVIAVEK